jgi:hypothetical protein
MKAFTPNADGQANFRMFFFKEAMIGGKKE